MSYLNIKKFCQAHLGWNDSDEDIRDRINQAAKELYDENTLINSRREQKFSVEAEDDGRITLPWYVDRVLAARPSSRTHRIDTGSLSMKYNTVPWESYAGLTMTQLFSSPLQADFENEGPITIEIAAGEAADIEVVVVGSGANNRRVAETIIISAGNTSATSSTSFFRGESFRPFESITKKTLTNNDLVVKDSEGVQITFIPNHLFTVQYDVLQVSENSHPCSCVEFLFKHRFMPMLNDYDTFFLGDRYDMAIFYKCKELYGKLIGDEQMVVQGMAFLKKTLEALHSEWSAGQMSRLDFGRNNITDVITMQTRRYY